MAIVEDHLLQRLRTEELIEHESGLKVVHACETLPDLLTWLATTNVRTRPHVVILDLVVDRGPDASADMVETLIAAGIRVLVLSALGSATLVRDVMRVGVHGIVSKRDTEADVVNAVWSVLRRRRWITSELGAALASRESRPPLSDQEERALVLYSSGLTVEAVAAAIGVRPGTAKKYLERVKRKYAAAGRPVRNKLEMSREAARDGLLNR